MSEQIDAKLSASMESHAGNSLGSDQRLSDILANMLKNADNLLRQEVDLALAKLEAKVNTAKSDLVTTTTGGAVLYAGILALVTACILGLSRVLEPSLAALVVGLAVSGIGYSMLQSGGAESTATDLPPLSPGSAQRPPSEREETSP